MAVREGGRVGRLQPIRLPSQLLPAAATDAGKVIVGCEWRGCSYVNRCSNRYRCINQDICCVFAKNFSFAVRTVNLSVSCSGARLAAEAGCVSLTGGCHAVQCYRVASVDDGPSGG